METQEFTEPLRYWIVDNFLSDSNRSACLAEVPTPDRESFWHRYDNALEKKWATKEINQLGGDINRLFSFLSSDTHVQQMRKLCGEEFLFPDASLHGAGIHMMKKGDFLWAHLDYDKHPKFPVSARALNLAVFLHGEWQHHWGGEVEFWDENGRHIHTRIEPKPGRAIIWQPTDTSFHSVAPVAYPDGCRRVSAAYYYLRPIKKDEQLTRTRALFLPPRRPTKKQAG